jgi:hypothetical protein
MWITSAQRRDVTLGSALSSVQNGVEAWSVEDRTHSSLTVFMEFLMMLRRPSRTSPKMTVFEKCWFLKVPRGVGLGHLRSRGNALKLRQSAEACHRAAIAPAE